MELISAPPIRPHARTRITLPVLLLLLLLFLAACSGFKLGLESSVLHTGPMTGSSKLLQGKITDRNWERLYASQTI